MVSGAAGRETRAFLGAVARIGSELGDTLEGAFRVDRALLAPVATAMRRWIDCEAAGETPDKGGLGAACRIGEADAACGFLHPHSDLEKAQPDRGELGFGEIADGRDRIAQGEQEPIRGCMQDEAHLVGFRPAA